MRDDSLSGSGAQGAMGRGGPCGIHVASSFTGEPLAEPLRRDLAEIPLRAEVRFAANGQLMQQLLDPRTALATDGSGLNVFLLRAEDFSGDPCAAPGPAPGRDFGSNRTCVLPNGMQIAELNPYETRYLYEEIFGQRVYERHGITIRDGDTVVDIGANIGMFALSIIERNPRCRVYSFEPAPAVFAVLSANARAHGRGNVIASRCGVWSSSGSRTFTYYPGSSVFSGFCADAGRDGQALRAAISNALETRGLDAERREELTRKFMDERLATEEYDCPIRSLSDLVSEHQIDTIDLLKIDAEGSELEILSGISDEDWKKIDQLVVEVHESAGVACSKVCELLTSRGYQVQRHEEAALAGSGLWNVYATRGTRRCGAPAVDTRQNLRDFAACVQRFAEQKRVHCIVGMAPPSPQSSGVDHDSLVAAVSESLGDSPYVHFLAFADFNELDASEYHDETRDRAGGIPYTPRYFDEMSSALCAVIAGIVHGPRKLIALDADGTLWDGVCAEEQPEELRIDGHLQRFMRDRARDGMLLCLVSKNDIGDVRRVFDENPNMVLRWSDFAAVRANWAPKSANLAAIAAELGLSPDSFVFLDDNPIECAEVRANCPAVLTLRLPADRNRVAAFLGRQDCLRASGVTAEDARRGEMYRENTRREEHRKGFETLGEYLESLRLEVTREPIGEGELARVAQLTARTNQFNIHKAPRTAEEIATLLAAGHLGFTARVRDRFGDYGISGAVLCQPCAQVLRVHTLLLSCRVLGRGVEYQLVRWLAEIALRLRLERVAFGFVPTQKNAPALEFLSQLECASRRERDGKIDFEFSSRYLANVSFEADRAPALPNPDVRSATPRGEVVPVVPIVDSGDARAAAPGGDITHYLERVLRDVQELPARPLARDVSFVSLGVDSFALVEMLVRLEQDFGRLPSALLFDHPTLQSLGKYLATVDPRRVEELARGSPVGARAGHESSSGQRQLESVQVAADAAWDSSLSFDQEAMWLSHDAGQGALAYNVPLTITLRGEVDESALQQSFARLVLRHEVLRTRFLEIGGVTNSVVDESADIRLEVIDLSSMERKEQDARIADLMAAETHTRFDLGQEHPIRWKLVRTGRRRHVLLLTLHHMVCDGWSLRILFRDLAEFYDAITKAMEISLPPLRLRYRDHVSRERARWQGHTLERGLAHWKEALAGAPPLLQLPVDRPRPPRRTFACAAHRFAIPKVVVDDLRVLGGEHDCSLYVTVLSAFSLLLHLYSGQKDFVLGSPVANRDLEGAREPMGYFTNVLPVRVRFDDTMSFAGLLGQVSAWMAAARRHEPLPFARLLSLLEGERNASHGPLVQTLFAYQNVPIDADAFLNAHFSSIERVHAESQFELTMEVLEDRNELSIRIEYLTELFDRRTIERFAGHFVVLLEALARDPELPVGEHSLLSEGERAQQLLEWNATARACPERCIQELFEAQVERRPNAVALVHERREVTYAQLNARANRLAHHLRDQGVGVEARVGICMGRSAEMVIAVLAALKAGAAYVPLDPGYPRQRLRYLLRDCAPAMVLTDARGRAVLGELGSTTPMLEVEEATPALANLPDENLPGAGLGLTPRHAAYVIYTSGSTGEPKGVVVEHRGLCNLAQALIADFAVDETSRVLQLVSLSFDVSASEIVMALCSGATLCVPPQDRVLAGESLLELLAENRITHVSLTPAALHGVDGRGRVPELRTLVVGGESYGRGLVEAWAPGRRFFNAYGPTEATVCATVHHCDPRHRGSAPIGRPISNVRTYILDRHSRPVPVGVEGEIFIGGAGIARGYLDHGRMTAERFVPDPFGDVAGARLYRTGDLARFRADGCIEFLGRTDHQVKVRGYRVEPGEIEACLAACAGVREAAVEAREEDAGLRRLLAFVVPVPGCAADEPAFVSRLRERLQAQLPAHMVPSVITVLPAMPLTANGKLDRKALSVSPSTSLDSVFSVFIAPEGITEELLAQLWCTLLGRARVGRDDDFFALGGHSLWATKLVSRIREMFAVELPVRQVFEHPSLCALARAVEQARGVDTAAGVPLQAVSRDSPLPLSYPQQGLWLLHEYQGANAVYNMPLAWRLRGNVDETALVRSLQELQRRHEPLRTRFETRDGSAVQVFDPPSPVSVEEVHGREIQAIADREAAHRFDLAGERLCRIRLLREAVDERGARGDYVLLITLHHGVADGWSLGILARELSTLYRACANGDDSPLAPLPIQYADFAHWQRRSLDAAVLEPQLKYWREQLRGLPPLLSLPTDRPRPPEQTFRGSTEGVKLPTALAEGLRLLSREQGVTLFMTLLSAWAALLGRYANQRDLAIGSAIANRTRPETEGLPGFFVNTLVMRHDLRGDPRFIDVLKRTRELALQAYAHADLPFERLVQELNPVRNGSHAPLFQAGFALVNAPREALELPGVDVMPMVGAPQGTARIDLTLSFVEAPEGLVGTIEYNTDLFDRATIRRMLGHYGRLLEGAVSSPELRLSQLRLLDESETRQQLVEWNATQLPFAADRCIHELFESQAQRRPDAVAVAHDGHELTREELNVRANRLAHYLIEQGVGPESRVGICMQRSIETVVAVLGVLKAGGAYVPLDPGYPPQRLRVLLEDSAPGWVLVDAVGQDVLADTGTVARFIHSKDDAPSWALRSPENPRTAELGLMPRHPAYVIYTSGSTGAPKGVVVEHRGLCNLAGAQAVSLDAGESSRVLQFASLSFDASAWEMIMALCSGAALYLPAGSQAPLGETLLEELARATITHATLPPAVLTGVAARPSLRRLDTLIVAGEACSRQIVDAWAPGRRFFNAYGPTEATVCATTQRCQPGTGAPGIGSPIANVRTYVLDRELQPVPVGVEGQLHLGGTGVARGYLNRAALTAARFIPDAFGAAGDRLYCTGDRARWLPDGTLEFMGRVDHQVKVRGFRIEPGEIESALLAQDDVRDAVVVAHEDASGHRLVGYVVARDAKLSDDTAFTRTLRGRLHEILPAHMVPSVLVKLDHLPLTANGKLDRAALPAPRVTTSDDGASPQGITEELLAGLWCALLKRDRAGRHENFFELGGHSLLATQLASRIRESLCSDFPVRQVFEHPTLSAQARAVERARGAGPLVDLPMEATPRDQPLPLSHAQERLWFLQELMGPNAVYNVPLALRLRGDVNEVALVRSLQDLQRRHESLRTRFETRDGHAVQVIEAPDAHIPVERVSAAEARVIAARDRFHAFDLARERLCRLRLLRETGDTPGDLLLLVTMHHSVSDAWSLGIFFSELACLYRAHVNGAESALAPLPLQYADYAQWQRRWLQGPTLEHQLAYWRKQLDGLPPLLMLPTDRPRPAEQTFRGSLEHFALPVMLSERLLALSRQHGVTLYMTLHSAFAVLLSRYSRQQDIAVGTPIANRTRGEVEGLIGFFVNSLVMRHDLGGDPRFVELLQRTRETALQAYAHQDVPFERLVETLDPERSLSHSPLFQVAFALENAPFVNPELPGIEVQMLDTDEQGEGGPEGTSRFDLTMSLRETPDGLRGVLEFNTDLFNRSTMQRLAAHYARLLESIVSDPQSRLSRLEMLGEAERNRLLVGWNRTERDFPKDSGFHDLFEECARNWPAHIAVIDGERRISFGELDRRATRLARHLAAAGVGPEVSVGICAGRSIEMVVGLVATLKAGGCYVPLDPEYPADRLAYLLSASACQLVLTEARLREALPPLRSIATLALDAELAEETPDCAAAFATGGRSAPCNSAYIMFTSGSTGRPKGVRISHAGLTNYLLYAAEAYFSSGHQGAVVSTSLSFDATVTSLLVPLIAGKFTWLLRHDADELERLKDVMTRSGQDLVFKLTPSHLEALEPLIGAAVPRSHLLVVGGEQLTSARVCKWLRAVLPRAVFVNEYGPTETVVGCSTHWVSRLPAIETGAVPIGRPISNTCLYVVDEYLNPVATGVAGELLIAGAGVAQEYVRMPAQTAQRFMPDPFGSTPGARLYRTGDLVRWLPDGNLEYLGRLDQQVKIRGLRIELGEIESVLLSHEKVRDAVVIARSDESGGRRLVGYVVTDAATGADGADLLNSLRNRLQQQLPGYMVPAVLMALPGMPLTANGKLDRKALPAPQLLRHEDAFVPPATPVERSLCEIWQTVLGIERIGVEDNFFAAGGDSISSIQVVSRAKARGLQLTVRELFRHPTITALARQVDLGIPGAVAPVARASEGDMPLLPIHRRFFESGASRPQHYHQSQLLRVPPGFSPEFLRGFVTALYQRHDALRLRYRCERGRWRGYFVPADDELLSKTLQVEKLRGADAASRDTQLLASARRVKAQFDLEHGPLFKAVYFEADAVNDSSLLLVFHHLVIDGVSWRILLHELDQAFGQWQSGTTIALSAATTSYQQWGEVLLAHADSAAAREEKQFWLTQLARPLPPLPTESPVETAAMEAVRVSVELDEEETEALLSRCAEVYRSQVQELLLAGLLQAFNRWTGQRRLRVDLEGHGREEQEFAGVDLTATVGWFTSVYPVCLELPGEDDDTSSAGTIKCVKEQLRAVPRRGLNYGVLRHLACDSELAELARAHPAPVLFNYLGQLDGQLGKAARFAPRPADTGSDLDASHPREHLLIFNGSVIGGRLQFVLDCDPRRFRRTTAERVCGLYAQALRHIVSLGEARNLSALTPSDFPLAFRSLERP